MTSDTRQHILGTAIRLFEERGYAGTTMRAIATPAGALPSNAYHWFASKDQLVQECHRRIRVAHRERSAEAVSRGGTLSERLLWLAHLSVTVHRVIDTSPGQEPTRALVERSVAMLVAAIRLTRLPGAAGLINQVGSVLDEVVPERRQS